MNEYEKLVESLRACGTKDGVARCEFCHEKYVPGCGCSNTLMQNAADAIEELLRAAKRMHTWIFLNTGDEQAAYDECGLSDEMNAALGYAGQYVLAQENDCGGKNDGGAE